MNSSWLFFAVAFLVGALITAQTGTNARLKEAFGETPPAVIVSSLLGVILLITVTLGARTPWPSLPSLVGTPWWGWLGGVLRRGVRGRHGTAGTGARRGAAHRSHRNRSARLLGRARPFRLGGLHRARGGSRAHRGLCSDGSRVRLDRALLRTDGDRAPVSRLPRQHVCAFARGGVKPATRVTAIRARATGYESVNR